MKKYSKLMIQFVIITTIIFSGLHSVFAQKNYGIEYLSKENKIKLEKIVQKSDTVIFHNGLIISYKKNICKIYDNNLSDLKIEGLRAFFPSGEYSNPQILVKNNIHYLNSDNKISNMRGNGLKRRGICGNAIMFRNYGIIENNGNVNLQIMANYDSTNISNYNFSKLLKINNICFLDGTIIRGKSSYLNENFSKYILFDSFIETQPSGKKSIIEIRIDTNKIVIKGEILSNIDEVVFEKNDTFFEKDGTPLRFRQGKLWGYYLLNGSAKYKSLDSFQYFFARFTLPNGKKGWIDYLGKEYLDQ